MTIDLMNLESNGIPVNGRGWGRSGGRMMAVGVCARHVDGESNFGATYLESGVIRLTVSFIRWQRSRSE